MNEPESTVEEGAPVAEEAEGVTPEGPVAQPAPAAPGPDGDDGAPEASEPGGGDDAPQAAAPGQALASPDDGFEELPEPYGDPILTPSDLLDLRVRLTAELGRARLPVAQVIGLGSGAIVDLDRAPEDPIDVYVNGLLYATGRLVLVGDEWALRIESVLGTEPGEAAQVPAAAGNGHASAEGVEEMSSPPSDG